MLNYVSMGTNNKSESEAFYDQVFSEMGAKRAFENERGTFWSNGTGPMIGVMVPENGNDATIGNGDMPALAAADREMVDRVYNKALELGATCEGAPGERFEGFYAAYFRDAQGNKLAVTKMG